MNAPHRPWTPLRVFAGALLWIGLALAGCEHTATPASGNARGKTSAPAAPGWVALERTSGNRPEAPSYVVTLFDDGRVMFEARANVKTRGTFSKRVPAERAAAVFTRMEAIELWQRQPRYDEQRGARGGDDVILAVASRDDPWDILTARCHGQFKRIDGLFYAPSDLLDLKQLIEDTVGLAELLER
jgi:hypothetical protein